MKFHVYIIESPNPIDLYHQRFEGNSLKETLRLSEISSSYHQTVDLTSFKAAFVVGLQEYFKESSVPPIIHISAHGDENGIELTSKERLNWDELRELLIPVNKALNGGLLLCLSSCKGISGGRMSMNDETFPFFAIIANADKPTWAETNIAYATFYHLFKNDTNILDAINAMKIASGNKYFEILQSTTARQAYINLVHTPQAIKTLESNTTNVEKEELKGSIIEK